VRKKKKVFFAAEMLRAVRDTVSEIFRVDDPSITVEWSGRRIL